MKNEDRLIAFLEDQFPSVFLNRPRRLAPEVQSGFLPQSVGKANQEKYPESELDSEFNHGRLPALKKGRIEVFQVS